jgi:hypothetical protein
MWILSALRGARLYSSQKSKKSFFRDFAVANRDGTTRHITKNNFCTRPARSVAEITERKRKSHGKRNMVTRNRRASEMLLIVEAVMLQQNSNTSIIQSVPFKAFL